MHDKEIGVIESYQSALAELARRGLLPIGGGSPDGDSDAGKDDSGGDSSKGDSGAGDESGKNTDNANDNREPEFRPITSQDALERVLDDRLKRHEKTLRDKVKAELAAETEAARAKEQGDFQALYDAEQKKVVDLETKIKAIEHETMRQRIASKHHVPAELIDRLKGDTEAELEADAKALAKLVREPSVDTEGGKGRRTSSQNGKQSSNEYAYGGNRPVVSWPGAVKKES